MATVLMVLFVILCLFLALFILIQQGKGDMGLGSLGGGQQLFGGSGGQSFFEKTTWIMGTFFIFGALALSIFKTKQYSTSQLENITISRKTNTPSTEQKANNNQTTKKTDNKTNENK